MSYYIQRDKQNCPFRNARHNLGRLGEHPKATEIITQAALQLPHLLLSYKIIPYASAPAAKIPLIEKQTTLKCLVNRFSSDSAIFERLLQHLIHLDRWSNLSERLQDDCATNTRIHAELYLVQLFHKRKFAFVNNDRFVGCSKPACYLCYEYINALNAGFHLPPSHNKLYLAWKPPSVRFGETEKEREREEKDMEDVLNRMTKRVRAHVNEQMEMKMERRWKHPDSTTGVSTAASREEWKGLGDVSDDEEEFEESSEADT